MNQGEVTVPISALEHHAYCPRQAALIHVDGVWVDNAPTVRGQVGHRRADHAADRDERGRRVLRSVEVWSEQLGLTGRCDTVEIHADGRTVPVEYKIGTRHGHAADIQLRAQAFCLEEMTGRRIDHGFVWYSAHRRRDRIEFDQTLTEMTLAAIDAVRATINRRVLPDAPADRRCDACQLNARCLPEIVADTARVDQYLAQRFT